MNRSPFGEDMLEALGINTKNQDIVGATLEWTFNGFPVLTVRHVIHKDTTALAFIETAKQYHMAPESRKEDKSPIVYLNERFNDSMNNVLEAGWYVLGEDYNHIIGGPYTSRVYAQHDLNNYLASRPMENPYRASTEG